MRSPLIGQRCLAADPTRYVVAVIRTTAAANVVPRQDMYRFSGVTFLHQKSPLVTPRKVCLTCGSPIPFPLPREMLHSKFTLLINSQLVPPTSVLSVYVLS